MKKGQLLIFMFIIISAVFLTLPVAEANRVQEFRHADKNKDGVIDKKERNMETRWEHKHKSRVNTWWEDRADTNNDGIVDSGELASWKALEKERIDLNKDGVIDAKERRMCWRHARSRVNTALEQKYDKDGDGWLDPAEARELLQDRYALIKTQGKVKVDTQLESEYDANGDGVLDLDEANNLKEDLGI